MRRTLLVTGMFLCGSFLAMACLYMSPPALQAAGDWDDGVAVGVIAMWSGARRDIPPGWALCDGQNGTPNLLDRFIFGVAAGEEPGATGGSVSHSHEGAPHLHQVAVPNHSHGLEAATVIVAPGGEHTHGVGRPTTVIQGIQNPLDTGAAAGIDHSHTIGTAGSTHTHAASVAGLTSPAGATPLATTAARAATTASDHLPPFFKLAYIIKVKASTVVPGPDGECDDDDRGDDDRGEEGRGEDRNRGAKTHRDE